MAGVLIVLSVLPFVAIPLGANTNLPLSSVVAGLLVLRCRRSMAVLLAAVLVAVLPFCAAVLRLFLDPRPWLVPETFTWVMFTLPLAGTAAAVVFLRERLLPWLSWTMLLSAVFVVIQKHVFIDFLNMVPFASWYDLPGYGTFTQEPETFLAYVRRPFGTFPESSFMAGSLSLMAMALVVTTLYFGRRLGARDVVSLLTVFWAVAVSGSGSAIVVLSAALFAAFATFAGRHALATILVLPPALFGALLVGTETLADRQSGFNWSWSDRYSSIAASAQLLLQEPVTFWFGLGRGRSNVMFLEGSMPLGKYQHYNLLPDIYSVLGRVVLENGALLGLPFVLALFVLVLRAGGRSPWWLGGCAAVVWLVVAGLTISYDSGFWIWATPGWFLGLEVAARTGMSVRKRDGS